MSRFNDIINCDCSNSQRELLFSMFLDDLFKSIQNIKDTSLNDQDRHNRINDLYKYYGLSWGQKVQIERILSC